jgi:hypothetical protein
VFESRHPDRTETPTIGRTLCAPAIVGVLLDLSWPVDVVASGNTRFRYGKKIRRITLDTEHGLAYNCLLCVICAVSEDEEK